MKQPPIERETISADEAAEIMNCSTYKVRELARAGQLPATKIGRSFVMYRSDVHQYLRDSIEARRSKQQVKTQFDKEYLKIISA